MRTHFKLVNLTKKEVVRSGVKNEDGSIRVRGWYNHVENTGPALAHLCMTRWAGDKVAVVCDSWSTTADKDLWQRSEKFPLLLAVCSLNQFGSIHVEIRATGMREENL